MKKIIIEILLLIIPFETVRNRWRRMLRKFSLNDFKYFKEFYSRVFKEKRVLLIEANDCHAVVLPSFAKYFIDLGYKVDMLTSDENINEKPFCCFEENIKIYNLNMIFILFLRFCKILDKYEKIVVLSSSWYCFGVQTAKYLGIINRENLVLVEHDTRNIEKYKEEKFVEQNKLITLWDFKQGAMVNTHYFGNVDVSHKKNEITNFIIVGLIEKKRRNYDLLANAIEELSKITDKFKITLVGNGDTEDLKNKYNEFVDVKGFLNFPEMFAELEKADYFLPLLDSENENHLRYLSTGITGSILLILGFLKPAIIQSKFAEFYYLNDENSITYEKNCDLIEVMQRAINLNENEYENLRNNLKNVQKNVYDKSLDNLKKICKKG